MRSLPPSLAGSRVCVIGAGAAGLSATRHLVEAGADVVTIERSDKVGGLWNDGYDSLHLITAKNLCSFRDFDLPDDYPMFPHRDQIVWYFNEFADHFDLRKRIEFGTSVTAVRPLGDAGLGGWEVETSDGLVREFDAVVVANGHLAEPVTPTFAGTFTGRELHVSDYKNADSFDGDRVLVIGAGNSGCDIAVDAAQARLDVSICIRQGIIFQPKTLLGRGRTELLPAFVPPTIVERVTRAAVHFVLGDNTAYPGLPATTEKNLFKGASVINTQLLHWLHHGRLRVVPGITELAGRTVRFEDGTEREFDTIVYATGYKYTFPFLNPALFEWNGDKPVRHGAATLLPGWANLYMMGLVGPTGAQWPAYDDQAEIVLRVMDLQQRSSEPVVDAIARLEKPWREVNMPRHIWTKRLNVFRALLGRLERNTQSAPARAKRSSIPA